MYSADLSTRDVDGATPLHDAAFRGHASNSKYTLWSLIPLIATSHSYLSHLLFSNQSSTLRFFFQMW